VAIGEAGDTPTTRILDARSGDEVLVVASDDARWGDITGNPGPSHWLDEERLYIWGWTYSGMPGGSAILHLDGSVEILDPDARVEAEPALTYAMEGNLWAGCAEGFFVGATVISVRNSDGEIIDTIEAGGPLLGLAEFAPDFASVLYRIHLPDDDLLARLIEAEASGSGCLDSELELAFIDTPYEYRLRNLSTGEERTLSRLEAFGEWYGERAVSFACGDEELGGRVGFDAPYHSPPLGSGPPFGFADWDCGAIPDSIELRVDGATIATGRGFEVLGFIEVP
jgi:hypothetical protein